MYRCDRCKEDLPDAFEYPEIGMTAGFYYVAEHSGWNFMANPGEIILCDACAHKDSRYTAIYGGIECH